jgi:hypothetical protein
VQRRPPSGGRSETRGISSVVSSLPRQGQRNPTYSVTLKMICSKMRAYVPAMLGRTGDGALPPPLRGGKRNRESCLHGFRVGRLRRPAAPPVATTLRPLGEESGPVTRWIATAAGIARAIPLCIEAPRHCHPRPRAEGSCPLGKKSLFFRAGVSTTPVFGWAASLEHSRPRLCPIRGRRPRAEGVISLESMNTARNIWAQPPNVIGAGPLRQAEGLVAYSRGWRSLCDRHPR